MDDPEAWRWIWLAVAVGALAGEILTAGTFFLLPFGIGAGVACIAAFAGAGMAAQWLAFVLVSAVATAAVRPLARRLALHSGDEGIGARRWVGQRAVVLTQIPPGVDETGLVRIGREEWRAQAAGRDGVEPGVMVTVVDVLGTRLVVRPVDQEEIR